MKGYPTINVTQSVTPFDTTIRRQGLVVLVAPFKDNDYLIKPFANIDDAIAQEKGVSGDLTTGLKYLQILKDQGNKQVVLANLNHGDKGHDLTLEKLTNIFTELEDGRFEQLQIPYALESDMQVAYMEFFETKFNKGNPIGLVSYTTITDTQSVIKYSQALKSANYYGALYAGITTKLSQGDSDLTLGETSTVIGGLLSSLDLGLSLTEYNLEGYDGKVSKTELTEPVVDSIVDNGLIGFRYKDSFNKLLSIINGNNPDNYDIRTIRIYHSFVNDLIETLYAGIPNNEIKYADFVAKFKNVERNFINRELINSAFYEVDKTGLVSCGVFTGVSENEVLLNFDVKVSLEVE
ncbi:MAG: hypothetical protein ACRC1M_05740 [Methanobacteriaceae archaeon]